MATRQMTKSEARRFLREYDRADERFDCRFGHPWCSTRQRGPCSEEADEVLVGEREQPPSETEVVDAIVEPIEAAARRELALAPELEGVPLPEATCRVPAGARLYVGKDGRVRRAYVPRGSE